MLARFKTCYSVKETRDVATSQLFELIIFFFRIIHLHEFFINETEKLRNQLVIVVRVGD